MNRFKTLNARRLSIAAFSFSFAYLLSFLFEGQVLYSLLDLRGTDAGRYILTAIIAHFAGLFTCGLYVKSQAAAKSMMLGGMRVDLLHGMLHKQTVVEAAQKLWHETGVRAEISDW